MRFKAKPIDDSSSTLLTQICALMLALAPILDPYILGNVGFVTVRVMDIVLIALASALIIGRMTEGLQAIRSLICLITVLLFCTLISSCFSLNGRSTISALALIVKYGLYAICFGLLCGKRVLLLMMKYATAIAVIGAIYIVLQYVLTGAFGISLWDGVLPLAINETDGFSALFDRNTGEIRPHAFYQEPSYYAIYAAPVIMFSINRRRWLIFAVLVSGLLLSTSFLGVVVLVVAAFVLIGNTMHRAKKINWMIAALIVSILFLIVLLIIILYYNNIIIYLNIILDNALSKINSIINVFNENTWGRSSAQYRLLGNIELFQYYSPLEMIFGVGMGQYASVFSNQIESGYSSTAVNILLNCGLVGLISLVLWLLSFWKRLVPGCRVYLLLFAAFLFVDNCWFNCYFFYSLSWVIAAGYLSDAERSLSSEYVVGSSERISASAMAS